MVDFFFFLVVIRSNWSISFYIINVFDVFLVICRDIRDGIFFFLNSNKLWL